MTRCRFRRARWSAQNSPPRSYWLSPTTAAARSLDGWLVNLGDWYLPFLGTTALYVAIGAVFHVLVSLLARTADGSRTKLVG